MLDGLSRPARGRERLHGTRAHALGFLEQAGDPRGNPRPAGVRRRIDRPRREMRELSLAEIQAVEIARALGCRSELVVTGEPTSALSGAEVEALMRAIADLKRSGASILYISRRMDEVFRVADSITVLRDGRRVATHPENQVDERGLIAEMVGRDVAAPSRDAATRAGELARGAGADSAK